MIAKLESSGLGYNVKAVDATEKLGKPPSFPPAMESQRSPRCLSNNNDDNINISYI